MTPCRKIRAVAGLATALIWGLAAAVAAAVPAAQVPSSAEFDLPDASVESRSAFSRAMQPEYHHAPGPADGLPGEAKRLAERVLADLGDSAANAPPSAAPAPPAKAMPAGEASSAGDELASGSGVDLALLPPGRRDDPISINSEELEVLPQGGGRRLVFSQNVEVLQGDISLNADRLEAVYPEGASQPERLLASGHVLVVQGDRRARCEEAVYERGPYTIVCRGKAEVLQACDRVRGEEIEFDLERERVRVTGAASVLIRSEDAKATGCADMEREGR